MQIGDRLEAGESLSAHNGACRLRLTETGILEVQRRFENHPIYRDDYVTAWTSGVAQDSGDFFARLNRDGNFVVYERHKGRPKGQKYSVAYRTRTNDPSNVGAKITLEFDKACRLTLYKNKAPGTSHYHPNDVFLWTNIKFFLTGTEPGGAWPAEPLGTYYMLLQKGEMFYDNWVWNGRCLGVQLPVTLYLTHECNLEMFIGTDLATRYHNVGNVWDANVTRPELKDCYLYGNTVGLTLHEGLFNKNGPPCIKNRPGQYWANYLYGCEDDDYEYFHTECLDGDYEAFLDPPNGFFLEGY